jgi:multiple antibiotic resistance protein
VLAAQPDVVSSTILRKEPASMTNSILMHSATVFMGFFAIMNPIANVPIFLGLTADDDAATTKAIAQRALLLSFGIIAVFSVAGKLVFELFGLALPAFQITGGILVALIGYQMLQGNQSSVHQLSDKDTQASKNAALGVAVSPLAMPIMGGPGTIATAMNFSAQGGIVAMATTITAFAILCVITYVLFISGKKFVAFIGAGALGVITRLMGLILAAIGVQMLITGINGAFKISQ